jgi:hypothetical protein
MGMSRRAMARSSWAIASPFLCAAETRRDGLEHFWVDTCCINKDSSAELSEAINSIFKWYHKAKHCYVYLAGVSLRGQISDLKLFGQS